MTNPTFVDLFCGAGGLSLGLSQSGWRQILSVDNWSDAIETYKTNFPNHQALLADVRDLTTKRLNQLLVEKPDWVVGGPPCQGFSTVGKRIREDPRNQLVLEFARIVKIIKPFGFLIENVVGLRDMKFVDQICDLFEDSSIGYRVTPMILRAADYGVPQLRHRIIFVGRRDGMYFLRPNVIRVESNFVSVWDAIGDLPPLSPGEYVSEYSGSAQTPYQRMMRRGSRKLQGHHASLHPDSLVKAISFIPDGGNRTAIPPEFQPKSGFHNSYSRLDSKAPAVAVTQNMGKPSGTRCIHPFQHRGLTTREGARLQGFPDRFHFRAGISSQRLQVANAVSPILAEVLGKALVGKDCWSDTRNSSELIAA
jgi:DNA (cytosine-5)-methyltransferase 1